MSGLCVLSTSCVPPGIRGALNQWMIEVLPGIFVGRPSRRVRDHLWVSLVDAFEGEDGPYAALIHQSDCEQGYRIEKVGDHRYAVTDFDGLQLITVRHRSGEAPFDPLEELPDPSW